MTDITLACREIVDLVTEYMEGGLPPAQRLAFERHVAICPPCRGHLAQLRKLSQTAGGLREEDLPDRFRASLLEAFRGWRQENP